METLRWFGWRLNDEEIPSKISYLLIGMDHAHLIASHALTQRQCLTAGTAELLENHLTNSGIHQ